jgi:hypothetical protein
VWGGWRYCWRRCPYVAPFINMTATAVVTVQAVASVLCP